MTRTSQLDAALVLVREARSTVAALAGLRHLAGAEGLHVSIPGEEISTGPGEYEQAAPQQLRISAEATREALRHRLRTLVEDLGKLGLVFDEAGDELPKRQRAAKPAGRKPRQVAARPEAVA
ncbi:hypothetical protein UFOVP99_8 [uncultured Caudovirales phage]|uniref:Uncharacterized protein n=1 Tax=uncultured Caudovirales phage TaxID=2100421 RepID=A0A6J5L4A1_9CAUD|nr:hypothetical protein UFOVP99_8 [uncultured Caudovirales phage]